MRGELVLVVLASCGHHDVPATDDAATTHDTSSSDATVIIHPDAPVYSLHLVSANPAVADALAMTFTVASNFPAGRKVSVEALSPLGAGYTDAIGVTDADGTTAVQLTLNPGLSSIRARAEYSYFNEATDQILIDAPFDIPCALGGDYVNAHYGALAVTTLNAQVPTRTALGYRVDAASFDASGAMIGQGSVVQSQTDQSVLLPLAEGRNTIRAQCVSVHAGTSFDATPIQAFADTVPPAIVLLEPLESQTITAAMDVDGDPSNGIQIVPRLHLVGDDLDGWISVEVTNANLGSYTLPYVLDSGNDTVGLQRFTVPSGTAIVQFGVRDWAGNTAKYVATYQVTP